jgi:hypothetical protein
MAYIGSTPADQTTGARPRDEFLGNGVQYIFPLDQPIPGGFESNVLVVVDNVIQEPVEAYLISDLVLLSLTNVVGTISESKYIRVGTAEGIIVEATSTYVKVYVTSALGFSTGSAIVSNTAGGTSIATATVSAIELQKDTGLHFTGVPEVGQNIYAVHQGGLTYQLIPAAGSVTVDSLATNLKAFTVDKFTSTSGQTVFNLSTAPASSQAIIVTANGSVYTDNVDFTLNETTLTLAVGLSAGVKVTVFHLGFGTVSRNAFTDGSVTTRALEDLAVTTSKLAAGAVTGPKLATGATVANLGFTPVNKAGDTLTGDITVPNIILAAGAGKGRITFPTNSSASTDPYTLDDYQEGEWFPTVAIGGASTGITYSNAVTYGTYTKIGNRVICTGRIVLTSKGALTGNVTVEGLPFAPYLEHIANVLPNNVGVNANSIAGRISQNSGVITLFNTSTGTLANITNTNINNNTEFFFNFTYQSND